MNVPPLQKVITATPTLLLLLLLLLLNQASTTNAQSISVNKACVKVGDTFDVTFQNKNQLDTDWIAVVSGNANTRSFTDFGAWVWTCGSQTCDGAVAMGQVRFRANTLAAGTWRAVLARDDGTGAPFAAYAKSATFTIATTCPGGTAPVKPPVAAPSSSSNANTVALGHINAAKTEIETLIRNDGTWAAQFLRMGFHDCIGGCDGCIDIDNPDNAGLEQVIDILAPIVSKHGQSGVSRADIFALATTVGADVKQRSNSRVDMKLKWWGRVDCEKTGKPCLDASGNAVTCSAKKGPHHEFPSIHFNTHELYAFFKDNFGFNQRDTVAIMGAHTMGVIRTDDFGFDGSNGWVINNQEFSNQYYTELIGGTSKNDPVSVLINDAPAWRRAIENGHRHWRGFPGGVKIVMLNADIALVRNLDASNMDSSVGRVTCTFEDNSATATLSVCPHVEGALQIAAEFKNDNKAWLRAFENVLDRMLTNGYKRNSCSDRICKLKK